MNNQWIDRVQNTKINFNGVTAPIVKDGSITLSTNVEGYIKSTMDFGRHFKIVFDAGAKWTSEDKFVYPEFIFMDIGSICGTNRGFSCCVHTRNVAGMNYKMFGNDESSRYVFPPLQRVFRRDVIYDGIWEFGNEEYDTFGDILWVNLHPMNTGKVRSVNSHPIITHNNMGAQGIFLNRGVAGFSYSEWAYSQTISYRSIKIYVYD